MEKIILYTKTPSIQTHWLDALSNSYNCICIKEIKEIMLHVPNENISTKVLIDELSLEDVKVTLKALNTFPSISVLLFNAVPEVYHASTLIKGNVKGYENSYIHKTNLLQMLQSVHNGKNWLFTDLTNFIINRYIQNSSPTDLEFLDKLTATEKEIAIMVSNGLTNKEIVQEKKIALSTVKGHMHNIFEKVGVSDRVSLALRFK